MIAIDTSTWMGPAEPAMVRRVRLRANRRALFLRSLAGDADRGAEGLGAANSQVEPWDHLGGVSFSREQMAEAELRFHQEDAAAKRMSVDIAGADAESATSGPMGVLRDNFQLTEPEVDLLSIAISVEADPGLAGPLVNAGGGAHREYYLIQGRPVASPWLVAQLFGWPSVMRLRPSAGLHRYRLVRPAPDTHDPWSATSGWVADPYIVDFVLSGSSVDPALEGAVLDTQGAAARRPLYPEALDSLAELVTSVLRSGSGGVEIDLLGAAGTGKRTLAAQLCERVGFHMLALDAAALLGPEVDFATARERVIRATRCGKLLDAALYWQNADVVSPRVWSLQESPSPVVIFGASEPPVRPSRDHVTRRTLRLPALSRTERAALWGELSNHSVPAEVRSFLLTPADIVAAARAASAGPEAVAEACKPRRLGAEGQLSRLPCPYTWDDIVLPPSVAGHLRDLMSQLELRWDVYEEWGFERLCPLGRGITALFGGPSGTGKTMAAQVVARALGMDLYRVDLATVVSKYIGETEKNLKQVFDACERANVVLFFDEADALFGQRTQVKDAHDRFANIEIDYLLQRMEQYDGLAILATNRRGDMDPAFLRRIRFIIDFVQPGPAERRTLWQKALSPEDRSGDRLLDSLDWDHLAARLDMSGADIKAAALGAAFLARSEGTRIGMRHVFKAAARELTKRGVVLRPGDIGGHCS